MLNTAAELVKRLRQLPPLPPLHREEIELIPRGDMVRLQSFPDDLRGAAINPNARIVIPGRYAESSRLAKVLTLGDGRMRNGETHIFSVQVGDTVLCTRYPKTAQSFKWNEEEVLLVSESEILAKVNYAE